MSYDFPNRNSASGYGSQMSVIQPSPAVGQVIKVNPATKKSVVLPSTPARNYGAGMAIAYVPVAAGAAGTATVIREAFPTDNIIGFIMNTVLQGTINDSTATNQPFQQNDEVAIAGNGNTMELWAAGGVTEGDKLVYLTSSQAATQPAAPFVPTGVPYGQVMSVNDANIANAGTAPKVFGVALETRTDAGLVMVEITSSPSA